MLKMLTLLKALNWSKWCADAHRWLCIYREDHLFQAAFNSNYKGNVLFKGKISNYFLVALFYSSIYKSIYSILSVA